MTMTSCRRFKFHRQATRRLVLGLLLFVATSCAAVPEGHAGLAGLTRVASGLSSPIYATHAPGDSSRLFIVLRGGGIRILDLTTGTLLPTPFLTMSGVDSEGEGGLISMAFHPDYATNGRFYTYSTQDNGGVNVDGATSPFSTFVREWTVSANPNIANTTPKTVLTFARPQNNHVGGWLGFRPGEAGANLYITSGDGGGGNDTGSGHTAGTGNAQDTTSNWFGKILRVNVNGDDFLADLNRNYAIPPSNPFTAGMPNEGGDEEIWDFGLRNPFRASFDRLNGNLWIGDVGQGAREEVDFEPANFAGGGNYGWRLREGTIQTPTAGIGGAKPPGAIDPVYDYDRDADAFGGIVITGGYVYRGIDPTLKGKYFFLDSRNSNGTSDDNYWMFDPANPVGTVANVDAQLTPNVGTAQFPVSFGEDALGNLYVTYIASGEVYRINTNAVPEPVSAGLLIVGACAIGSMRRRRRER